MPARASARVPRPRLALTATTGLVAGAVALGLAAPAGALDLPGVPGLHPTVDRAADVRVLGDTPLAMPDLDRRGSALPSATQRRAASALSSAISAQVRWNRFGTPAVISPRTGSLGRASSSDPAVAARTWLRQHASLLGLSAAQVDALELVGAQPFTQSRARAVLFRQRFGGLPTALGSMVTVGVAGGRIQLVTSSLVKASGTPAAARLSPAQGWLRAARDLGAQVSLPTRTGVSQGWTRFAVPGFAQVQMARPRSLALADGSVRPVVEANVVDVQGSAVAAYTSLVDAVTGAVLYRENKVDQATDTKTFQGTLTATDCGPKHAFAISDNATKRIDAAAGVAIATNDIELKLFGPGGTLLTTGDTGTSPETASYAPGGALPQGSYAVQVCPFDDPTVPFVGPDQYAASVSLSEQETPSTTPDTQARWRYFDANPTPVFDGTTPKNSVVGCFVKGAGCTEPTGPWDNLASRLPWDADPSTGQTTGTTIGNNANTHEAWASPLTPGGTAQAPQSPQRDYTTKFTDAWNNSKCDPTQLVPGGNDILASVTNLFVAHNRMHDYAYFLGFTERNYNLQSSNFGRGGAGGDAEIGNTQAGALTGGQPSYLGRDNANQIALQDGVPGITNQYLFQPIAGSFYSPCTDGGMDMGIVGHEYTHAISNRMVGGPDEGLTSEQGGAMGESWGDLTAGEYMFSNGYRNGGNPWAVGLYATGNKSVAIRDYSINHNPLTYGEYGFDSTGPEVHADGEIWNATNWRVRQALVRKWNATYPYSDKALQLRCARGKGVQSPLPASRCPGNRRWIQLVFDAFLLQQGATSMLDARDAMLAADRMRFGGADQKVLWKAFARSGMGTRARTPDADSSNPTPSFATPTGHRSVRFGLRLPSGKAVAGKVYVGTYEARATPVADTLSKTGRDAVDRFAPGTYRGLVQSARTGLQRVRFTVRAGRGTQAVRFTVHPNLAGQANGAKVVRSSSGSLNPSYLIDATEGTNWAGVVGSGNVDDKGKHPFVVVDLAGSHSQRITRFLVSAMLRPAPASPTDVPLAQDPDSGSRFTALRKFGIDVCTKACTTSGAVWKRVYTSSGSAFPSVRPRPTAPTLNARVFRLRSAVRATHVRLVALENQCTGFAGYAGEIDNDPTNDTDCKSASDRGSIVHAAELEVFGG
ncbi:M36 family metallopeptidase [Nocardioides marmoribigeumensis]|uniref:Peptidase M36 n=1 Tax=Nocardioides marmoribigeumensis TaxID=433649 RepID=A0ABU2BZ35_9ACTN|nr:M36 family metallopeptidase [Nocardioides marmoribigeumensis]MDR7363666.1 hypothetical protein [Nocardioides marmoribigeumensis]